MRSLLRNSAGQSQLLAASVIGTVVLTGALFSLDWARRNRDQDLYASRRVEMRSALEQAIKLVSHLYHNEAGCDPVSLDDKLAVLRADGTVGPQGVFGRRQLTVTVNGHVYTVGIGDSVRLDWAVPLSDPTVTGAPPALQFNRGTTQDAVTEVWTTYNSNATAPVASGIFHQRVSMRAVLINTCTNPCSSAGGPECPMAADRAIAYHQLQAASFPTGGGGNPVPGAAWNKTCFDPLGSNARYLGDLNAPPGYALPDGIINTTDLFLLKNYVRSGDPSGATPSPIPVGPPMPFNGVTHVGQAGSRPCADFNGDSLVNETDLHLLEKYLRGYLFWLPTHPLPPPL